MRYIRPGSTGRKYDSSQYGGAQHAANLELLNRSADVLGADERKKWFTTGLGTVMLAKSGATFDFASVYAADDDGRHRVGVHFVKHQIRVHEDKGIKARTLIYPTIGRVVSIYTSSDAAWVMDYPTLNRDPELMSEHLAESLTAPHELAPLTAESLEKIFPVREFALKHWVGVKPASANQ